MNTCNKNGCPEFPVFPPLSFPGWAVAVLCTRHGLDLARDDSFAATLGEYFKAALVMDALVGAGNVAGVRDHMDTLMATRTAVRTAVRAWLDEPCDCANRVLDARAEYGYALRVREGLEAYLRGEATLSRYTEIVRGEGSSPWPCAHATEAEEAQRRAAVAKIALEQVAATVARWRASRVGADVERAAAEVGAARKEPTP